MDTLQSHRASCLDGDGGCGGGGGGSCSQELLMELKNDDLKGG